MSDLEQDIRRLLDEETRSAPPPPESGAVVRRTRRRQGAVIVGGAWAAVALVAASLVGLRAIDRADRATFLDQPSVTTSLNGITISHPAGWHVVDPDEAGLNGPNPTPELPRLILAVAPYDPGELFGCPGMVQGTPHQFLMTVQEEPLALSGGGAGRWPVELEPLEVGAAESGCYPGWEFLRAGWTAAGRTFEGRMGFAPDVSDADRDELLDAFASMTFEPVVDAATSVVLATGAAGGEDWELIAGQAFVATSGESSLVLSLEAESISSGMGFDPSSKQFQIGSQVLGIGSTAERVVFGAVSSDAARLGLQVLGGEPVALPAPEILDVPDTIDPDLNAFVFTIRLDQTAVVIAFDETNTQIASGEVGPGAEGSIGTPFPGEGPLPEEVRPEQGGAYWGAYLWLGPAGAAAAESVAEDVRALGATPSVGELTCDQGAAEALGANAEWRVAVYFQTRQEAQDWLLGSGFAGHEARTGVARVTTFCLD